MTVTTENPSAAEAETGIASVTETKTSAKNLRGHEITTMKTTKKDQKTEEPRVVGMMIFLQENRKVVRRRWEVLLNQCRRNQGNQWKLWRMPVKRLHKAQKIEVNQINLEVLKLAQRAKRGLTSTIEGRAQVQLLNDLRLNQVCKNFFVLSSKHFFFIYRKNKGLEAINIH